MTSPTSTPVSNPLSNLTQLSPSVYLFDPTKTAKPACDSKDYDEKATATSGKDSTSVQERPSCISLSSEPKVIVLLTWMSAHPLHISKYISGYQVLYPDSRIVLVRNSVPDVLYRPSRTQRHWLNPAVDAIIAACSTNQMKSPEILLHIFSNGGCHSLLNLIAAYKKKTSRSLPLHVKIFDSCPGRGTVKESINSVSASLPKAQPLRAVLLMLLYAFMFVYWLILTPTGLPDPIERIRRALVDNARMKGEIWRCYIYSKMDFMVRWTDVQAHVSDALNRAFLVRVEEFADSGHCAHVRIDGGKRYWGIVRDFWMDVVTSYRS